MSRTGLFKYKIDIVSVSVVLVSVALSFIPFFVSMSLGYFLAFLFGLYFLRTYTPFIQHNHGHLPVFNSSLANWFLDLLLTQCTGYPTSLWELNHNRGHHRHFLNPPKDVARITWLGSGKLMSQWMYALRGNLTIHMDSIRIGWQERLEGKKSLLSKLAIETIQQSVITILLLVWNAKMAILCFIVPNLVSAWFIWWQSYNHHLDVPGTSIYDGSVTILSKLYNYHTFNIGHHTAHHEKPTLHWAQLPERTAQILSKLPENCIQQKRLMKRKITSSSQQSIDPIDSKMYV